MGFKTLDEVPPIDHSGIICKTGRIPVLKFRLHLGGPRRVLRRYDLLFSSNLGIYLEQSGMMTLSTYSRTNKKGRKFAKWLHSQ